MAFRHICLCPDGQRPLSRPAILSAHHVMRDHCFLRRVRVSLLAFPFECSFVLSIRRLPGSALMEMSCPATSAAIA
jgi:hypothetical protein